MEATWKLGIEREKHQGVMVLTVTGRLGSRDSGQLIDAVLDILRDGHRDILLNLSGVDYMSSAGTMALDAVGARVHDAAGNMVLCGVREPVRLVLDMAGLLDDLALEPSIEAGLERLRRV